MINSKWTHHILFIYTYIYISVYTHIFNNKNIKEEVRNLRVCEWNTGGAGTNRWRGRNDANIELVYKIKKSNKKEK